MTALHWIMFAVGVLAGAVVVNRLAIPLANSLSDDPPWWRVATRALNSTNPLLRALGYLGLRHDIGFILVLGAVLPAFLYSVYLLQLTASGS